MQLHSHHLLIQVTGESIPQPADPLARGLWNTPSACSLMSLIAAHHHDRCTSHCLRGPAPCVHLRIVEPANFVRCAVVRVRKEIPHHWFPGERSAPSARWSMPGIRVTVVHVALICSTRRLTSEPTVTITGSKSKANKRGGRSVFCQHLCATLSHSVSHYERNETPDPVIWNEVAAAIDPSEF
jgi:hypothetical protein